MYPDAEQILRAPAVQQQLLVLAHFDDGTSRDVTRLATYDSSSSDVVCDLLSSVTTRLLEITLPSGRDGRILSEIIK